VSAGVPSVDEVYGALLEDIGAGVIEVGSRLPSCRAIADELGSNPSTVNRAIRRLSRHGLVRTQPRVGSFLVNAAVPELSRDEVQHAISGAVRTARRSGLATSQIRELFETVLAVESGAGRSVAFVECNQSELDRMSLLVENTTGVALKPILIDDLKPGWESRFDVVAAPMFHLVDIADVSDGLDRVVELNFIPSASVLRELATLRPSAVVAVVAPTLRGVQRMRALVSQYHAGTILVPDLDGHAPFDGVDVVIHPGAIDRNAIDPSGVHQVITIDWELDPGSSASFASRVAAAAARG
jgi:DNA-binding transcriptional regulator YhcF (GntR family)